MNYNYNQLLNIFQFLFNWNLARVSFLTTFVISFLQCSTVNDSKNILISEIALT